MTPCKGRKRLLRRLTAPAAGALLAGRLWHAHGASVAVVPEADAFVRSYAPASNYGASGALSVSGSAAVNGSGTQNGSFDTLMRFALSNAVASLDDALGGHDWVITGARLLVTEMAAPDNAIFNLGVGAFEVRWQAADEWLEGTGKPNAPTSDGVAWQDLARIVNSNLDTSLGVFTNAGADGQESFALALADRFISDLRLGHEVTLRLTANSSTVGFTFNSRNFGNTNAQPLLELTALANPRPVINSAATAGGNITLAFSVTTNWTYRLQRSDAPNSAAVWTDLLTIPPQSWPTNLVYEEGLTNSRAFYRLSVSP